MNVEEYIKHIKHLLKEYHPDLCQDETLKDAYNEITIKLNITLNQLSKKNDNTPIIESKPFNIFSFRYYFAKIQSIGIGKNSLANKDFHIFRNFLISEIKKDNEKIAQHFAFLLSDENIRKKSINLFAEAYASYNSIFQNYYQYTDYVVKQSIIISDSYFVDYMKVCEIAGIDTIIKEIKEWLQQIGKKFYEHFPSRSIEQQ